ncbi:hypothetical protein B9Z55_021511 [Caenorhabditis nigoni]|uniref:Uncharacterized protein n=1 Tax=Caenorhabditis nigoni TaxID=1611254 RepID=A0A2G5TT68_9PELO|nr:hypothetical protein B9Z55_021511 [Caenorhabditis nigoni]
MDFSLTREATPVVQEATETAAVSQEGSEDTQEPLSTHEATPPRQTEPLETIQQSTPSSSLLVAATPDREVTPQPRLDTLETMSVAPETDKNVLSDKGVENEVDSTPTMTTPGKRICAQCTGGNYHLRWDLMHVSEHGQDMGWVEEWATADCVDGKIRYTSCVTTCMTVTIQRPENGEKLDSIMMACADDMFWSTPDIPDTRAWYKRKDGMIVFEEDARYVAERMSHTIVYEFNTTSSDDATTIGVFEDKIIY